MKTINLDQYGIKQPQVFRNLSPSNAYEMAIKLENGEIASNGALLISSGEKTGRSPKDKRLVEEETSRDNIWWGDVNVPISEDGFELNKDIAVNWLDTRERVFVLDGYAGWDPDYRIKVRVICARAYHALFMHNMLIRPSEEELESFEPDWVIYNAGQCSASSLVKGVSSKTSVNLNIKKKEFVILSLI